MRFYQVEQLIFTGKPSTDAWCWGWGGDISLTEGLLTHVPNTGSLCRAEEAASHN